MNSEEEYDRAFAAASLKIPPVAPTTFNRMRDAAAAAAFRIENGQCGRMMSGDLVVPMPEEIRRRDDFDGIVRLLDEITANPDIIDMLRPKKATKK